MRTYSLDDTNGSLVQVFVQKLFVKNGTQYLEGLGPVRQIDCLSLGSVVGVIWDIKESSEQKPITSPPPLAFFSPFGAQWWTSLEDTSISFMTSQSYSCLEWGVEGYQLWLGYDKFVHVMNVVHSVQDSLDRVVLMGSDRICVSPRRGHHQLATAPQFVWRTYPVPHDYVSANWPVRCVGFDADCNKLMVAAGARGFCFLNMKTNKWRLFRKEAQEKSLFVTGGVAVFDNHVVVCACDTVQEAENIYIFHHEEQLDLDQADKVRTGRILSMTARQSHLITFDVQCLITIFGLQTDQDADRERLNLQRIAEIRISDLLPHPTCVVSVQLTSLNYYNDATEFGFGMDALLVNVSGHLLLLSALNKQHPSSNDNNHFQLHPPMLIASNVERNWVQTSQSENPHLDKALWINAGCRKMKVWLPISPEGPKPDPRSQSFMSRRIMLPVDVNTYPLAIDEDCLACGVESLSLSPTSTTWTSATVHALSRTSEVFMHRLLKQLLKRNLGNYALQIVSACRSLSYFEHILELLLHDVLEEEATSSEPIPEPLLPRVVAFVREFPEYLKVIVYCARKTELAIRNHLFTVSHQPRELFRMCLEEDQLETATSCLIVLQSMETATSSVEFATTLLDEALTKRKWKIAIDIVRFLQSIDHKDLENVPESPLTQKLVRLPPGKHQTFLPDADSEDYGLVYNSSNEPKKSLTSTTPPNSAKPSLVGQASFSSTSPTSSIQTPRLILNRSGSVTGPSPPVVPSPPPNSALAQMPELISTQVNAMLDHHAAGLLANFGIRDLGAFAAHLDYDLVSFFRGPASVFQATPDQFPLILMKLHAQFSWPYPVATELIVSNGGVSPSPSSNTVSLLDETSSISSEDVFTSPSFVVTPRAEGMPKDKHVRRLATDFNRKVFEKLCEKSKSRGTKQSEDEINLIRAALLEAGHLEWTLFMCILRQDISDLSQVLSRVCRDLSRLGAFLKLARAGLAKLSDWAELNCTAYAPAIDFFKEFVEFTAAEPLQLKRHSDVESTNTCVGIGSLTL